MGSRPRSGGPLPRTPGPGVSGGVTVDMPPANRIRPGSILVRKAAGRQFLYSVIDRYYQPLALRHARRSEPLEIRHKPLRQREGNRARKERIRIIGAPHLLQWSFRLARQLRKAFDGNLPHCRLVLSESLYGIPRHRKSARVLDVNVGLEHVAILN